MLLSSVGRSPPRSAANVRCGEGHVALEDEMAIVMRMHWPEVSREQYESARREVKWEDDTPKGAKFHVAWMSGDGFHVLDVWQSAADFDRFVSDRLMPAVKKLGIQGEPRVEIDEAIAIFAPDV